jgi:Mg/Co/Ni transporter MgtE
MAQAVSSASVTLELPPAAPPAGEGESEAALLAARFADGAVAEVTSLLCARGSESLLELVMGHLSSYGRMQLFRTLPLPRDSAGAQVAWRARCFALLRPSEMTVVLLEAEIADAEAYVGALAPGARMDALMSMSFGAVQRVAHTLGSAERTATDLARAYGTASVGRIMHHLPPEIILLASSSVDEALATLAERHAAKLGERDDATRRARGMLLVRDAENRLVGWTDAATLLGLQRAGSSRAAAAGTSAEAVGEQPPPKQEPAPPRRPSAAARRLSSAAAAAAAASAGASVGTGAGAMPSEAPAAAQPPPPPQRRPLLLSEVATPFLSAPKVTDESDELLRQLTVSSHSTLPVVDSDGVLMGLVRHHDAIRVLNERIATISAGDSGIHSYSKASAFLLVKKRLFWLLVLAALNFGVAAVVASFEETISQNLVLAGFIPLLAGMGGNIGAQASGLVIAGTSSRDISSKDIFRVLYKEMFVSSALAGLLGCVTAAMGYIRAHDGSKPEIAATLGCSMMVIAIISNFLGVVFPFAAIAVGVDPAVSSSPLITTVIDVLGISIYLVIARSILGI